MSVNEKEILDVIDRIEEWKGKNINYEMVHGGKTNNNWKVNVGEESYFVKIPGKGTEKFIDRKNCHKANLIAQNTGIGPGVAYFFEDNGVEIFEWIDGYIPMKFGDVFKKEKFFKMADTAKKFHRYKEIKLPLTQNAFDQTMHMIDLAKELKGFIPKEINRMEWLVKTIEEAIMKNGIEFVPCHNDLWSSNFLWNEKEKDIKLIDYEYASMNDECYDLGIWSAANYFSEDMDKQLIQYYYDGYDEMIFARFKLYKILQDIKWAMWSCVQAVNSPVSEFDYFEWLGTKMARLRSFWADPRLDYWLNLLKGIPIFSM
ncbi:MAG: choline/ethanolamine kinase family protein [Atribacterota bacterium]